MAQVPKLVLQLADTGLSVLDLPLHVLDFCNLHLPKLHFGLLEPHGESTNVVVHLVDLQVLFVQHKLLLVDDHLQLDGYLLFILRLSISSHHLITQVLANELIVILILDRHLQITLNCIKKRILPKQVIPILLLLETHLNLQLLDPLVLLDKLLLQRFIVSQECLIGLVMGV